MRLFARIGDRVVCQTKKGLFVFTEPVSGMEAHGERLKPRVGKEDASVSALRVQSVRTPAGAEAVMLFGYHFGVYVWEGGEQWRHIPVPEHIRGKTLEL